MPQYHISPDLLRELDGLRSIMEENILNARDFEDPDTVKSFYILRGFNEAVSYITNLVHGFESAAFTVKDRLLNYEGMATDLDFDDYEGED